MSKKKNSDIFLNSTVQSAMKHKLTINLVGQKAIILFEKKMFFIVEWTFRTVSTLQLTKILTPWNIYSMQFRIS